jgi:hypothetical protein
MDRFEPSADPIKIPENAGDGAAFEIIGQKKLMRVA